jgi:uncharacterized protein YaiL (DUF2058 family)
VKENVQVKVMANSLGDQFLKAGLVSKDQLNKAKKSKSKQQHQKNKQKTEVVDEAAAAARQAAAEKAARDRELNRRQREEVERKAVQAQVRQLVESNRLPRDGGELGYNFQDGTAIRKIFVSAEVRDKLARGLLAIARLDDRYELIPTVVAEKIMLRDESCIVSNAATHIENGEDDPYADYKVPDDLTW